MGTYEEREEELDPHRSEERQGAAAEVTARLEGRGVAVTGVDGPEELADLLEEVERFEAAVKAHGGDLMVDDLKSVRPDDQHFVLPRRQPGEGVRAFMGRVTEATARLRKHPRRPD